MIPVCFIDSSNSLKNHRPRIDKNSIRDFFPIFVLDAYSTQSHFIRLDCKNSRFQRGLVLNREKISYEPFSPFKFFAFGFFLSLSFSLFFKRVSRNSRASQRDEYASDFKLKRKRGTDFSPWLSRFRESFVKGLLELMQRQ